MRISDWSSDVCSSDLRVAVEDLVAAGPTFDAPLAYRITYDVVENGLPRVEEWTVRRPYEALVLSRRDGEVLSGSATSRSLLQTYQSDRDGWLPLRDRKRVVKGKGVSVRVNLGG